MKTYHLDTVEMWAAKAQMYLDLVGPLPSSIPETAGPQKVGRVIFLRGSRPFSKVTPSDAAKEWADALFSGLRWWGDVGVPHDT